MGVSVPDRLFTKKKLKVIRINRLNSDRGKKVEGKKEY
jgi:hypothetical protein